MFWHWGVVFQPRGQISKIAQDYFKKRNIMRGWLYVIAYRVYNDFLTFLKLNFLEKKRWLMSGIMISIIFLSKISQKNSTLCTFDGLSEEWYLNYRKLCGLDQWRQQKSQLKADVTRYSSSLINFSNLTPEHNFVHFWRYCDACS